KLQTKVGSGNAFIPLAEQIQNWRKRNFTVAFVAGAPQRAERLSRILLDLDIDASLIDGAFPEWRKKKGRHPVAVLSGHLSEGFIHRDEKFVLVSETEIFGSRSYRKGAKSTKSLKRIMSSLAQL